MKFLKAFGLGLVYIICLPLILVGVALAAIYGIGIFFYEFVLMIIHFFSGKKFFPPFEEDVEAQKIRQAQLDAKTNPQLQAAGQQPVYVQNVYYQNPNEENQHPKLNQLDQPPFIDELPSSEPEMIGYKEESEEEENLFNDDEDYEL